MNSLLTIIIPVYRVSNTMDRCIESIVSQKYDNMRIILVDDGSPDDCPEKCDRWAAKDNKITVIHKLNGGLSDARNAGLDIAGGDYITFVDSDDYIHPDTYYDVMHLISQHPEYDILEFPVYKFFGTSGQQLLTFSN
ncbi:glycosyltransferase family 2 protein, partial [Xylanibacter rodentium]